MVVDFRVRVEIFGPDHFVLARGARGLQDPPGSTPLLAALCLDRARCTLLSRNNAATRTPLRAQLFWYMRSKVLPLTVSPLSFYQTCFDHTTIGVPVICRTLISLISLPWVKAAAAG